MTREELRDYVDEQRTLNNIPYHVYSALIDGIDTLEQESCDDAISRQAVSEIAKSSKSNWIDNSVLFKRVNELPPVTPQPKTGRWTFIEENKHGIKVKCSECGAEVYYAGGKCTRCESKMEVSE